MRVCVRVRLGVRLLCAPVCASRPLIALFGALFGGSIELVLPPTLFLLSGVAREKPKWIVVGDVFRSSFKASLPSQPRLLAR
jgi:hypothetical protein